MPNRIVISPMCQYSADNGQATDWHLTHWTNLLNSGAGLFTIEATAVSERGRITPGCLGLYNDATAEALADVLKAEGEDVRPIGRVVKGQGVAYTGRLL